MPSNFYKNGVFINISRIKPRQRIILAYQQKKFLTLIQLATCVLKFYTKNTFYPFCWRFQLFFINKTKNFVLPDMYILKYNYFCIKQVAKFFLCEELFLISYNHIKMLNQLEYQYTYANMFGFYCIQQFNEGNFCMADMNTQVSISSDSQPIEDIPVSQQKLSELIADLPSKVYQNCQRTARVILLSELQKLAFREKKLKNQLSKILSQFIPSKGDQESSSQYSNKKGYFQSIHYSRVRIGQRHFKKNILLNNLFKEKFQIIFRQKAFERCQKARKNQRSPISFQKRTKIIYSILKQHQDLFEKHFKCSIPMEAKEKKQKLQKNKIKQEQIKEVPQFNFYQNLQNDLYPFYISPLVPIPLTPTEYQNYQKTKYSNH